jgi:serine-type D-Ala-D-Ala carboxypeptidase
MTVPDHWPDRLIATCNRVATTNDVPGGVVWVGRHDEVLTAFAFENRAIVPQPELATLDTIYDLASLTKPFITATLVMRGVELGLLNLYEPIGRLLPIPDDSPVAETTPISLLTHTSGLPASCVIPEHCISTMEIAQAMAEGGLATEPGTVFTYSDVGFHLLGAIVVSVFDKPLRELAEEHVLIPLGTCDMSYGVADTNLNRTAPTEIVEGELLRGVVHDGAARKVGGVCGHAGLFGTAADCARVCRMILQRGEIDGSRVLMPATVDRMIAPIDVPGNMKRALGWDVDTQWSSPRGEVFPIGGIGHTGYTGPSVWIDPPSGIYIVLMTNRVHPDGTGDSVRLRRLVANVVAASLLP